MKTRAPKLSDFVDMLGPSEPLPPELQQLLARKEAFPGTKCIVDCTPDRDSWARRQFAEYMRRMQEG